MSNLLHGVSDGQTFDTIYIYVRACVVILAKVLPGSVLNQVCVFTILLPNCPKPEKSGKNNEKYILEHPYTLKPKRDK